MSSFKNRMNNQSDSKLSTLGVYIIFTASGAAGLIYQVIWARWLGLVFGNTTVSISIVLSSFMIGLALGSGWVGRRLHRTQEPMRLYAYLELGIGIFAICFPVLSGAAERLFILVVDTNSSPSLSFGIRSILAFILLAVPTTFMGATLPLLTDFFRRNPMPGRSWKVGMLYAANTLGAALGTVFAGFFLIEVIGVTATTRVAAVLNVTVAMVGFKYSRQQASISVQPPETVPELHQPGKIALAVLTASGAVALASEVLWTRALETIVGNSTYAFSMILVVYLVGIAFGSWLMSLFVVRIKKTHIGLVALQAGMGGWSLIAILLIDLIRTNIFQDNVSAFSVYAYLANCLMAVSVSVPLAVLSGACFPLVTRIIEPESDDAQGALIARAYAWNTIGAVFGSLVAGFLIAPFTDFLQALYFLAALYGVVALTAYVFFKKSMHETMINKPLSLAFSGLLILLIAGGLYNIFAESHFVNQFHIRHPEQRIVFHKPGLQGITTVVKKRKDKKASFLLVNGMGMTTKITDTKMMAHLPMLMHPNPENTLVICFGMGTTFRSAISHGGKVTAVEVIEEVYKAFPYFYDDADRIIAYPKGKMITNDGRIFLKLTRERYDVITIDPPPPIDASGVTNLYSKDFLELTRKRLKDGGIMAHWIPFPGRRAGVDDWLSFNMLLATFKEVYPYSYILPAWNHVGMHVLGSTRPIKFSLEKIKEGLSVPWVHRDISEWDSVPADYFETLVPYKFSDYQGLIVTDDRPFLEFNLFRYLRSGIKKSSSLSSW